MFGRKSATVARWGTPTKHKDSERSKEGRKDEFPSDDFSDLKKKTSSLEEKFRSLYSENEAYKDDVTRMEEINEKLKCSLEQTEHALMESRKKFTSKEFEHAMKEAELQERISQLERHVTSLEKTHKEAEDKQERELKAKNERINQLEERNKHLEKLRKTLQSHLDESYQFDDKQEPSKWLQGLSVLPKVTMKFLAGYVADFATFWEELGMALGMENAVKAEQTQPISAKQKCLHVLQQWTTLASASYLSLLDALSKVSQRPLAVRIEEGIRKEIASSN